MRQKNIYQMIQLVNKIIELFPTILGISFDDDCYYRIEEE